ncbi:hydantoinase B/oxoprolinase family protein (plasmid) [Haloferax mediterranei ATCC 33500]|uniref:5-oxoprolinase n=1 Tax=Haloferax mediterranei (strain ATCC 33500 / DSM 1411 / JCM 8866 / NBRC 14739 / NCIMB 2177 / R-4) TaxID=523841 RepID=I3RAR2_HALMT|nr:hydantoinase B/oxoprolinase family protein [Haloferax mediterranei]AFK21322.1 N-methylhydantoinase B [Haloferax mediterranei ATCC 33500]AHZ24586.1 5-oxoprolinase [Haloferax mediterranei ATCC 33500]ELZ97348.1 N-methylhydantoinase B [Haloferax mediterranei ATCC 33500]MDX5990356.1 hydantoinase B/oxoprolinase family protein [Haloferax mediterranei ATCC 33500]QCQ76985.1 hydantoinase B/oxoprolinase family protein [Haloferax mediterranei ATCC 33500]
MTDIDAITLEIMRNQFESVAEEMGQVLITSSYSPNIKERRDCSTALFDAEGRLLAQAEHIPVHLGAMPEAVTTVLEYDPEPGDVFVLNDPFEGGTHLPDVTMVSPLTVDDEILGYAVSRAHHADVGGMTPGSMPAGAREIYQEGLRLPPVRLVTAGEINDDVLSLLLANVRNPSERRADIRAQIAANERAEERLSDLIDEHGRKQVVASFDAVMDYSRDRVTAELRDLPDGEYRARDVLEGDGVTDDDIPIEVSVTVDGESIHVDFEGTAPQVAGNVNAPFAVAKSAVYFVVRCVTDPEIPPNQGCYDPIDVHVPEGSLLNPAPPAAVVGGNVETSQRVTDVVFTAFAAAAPERVPAQGQGTMNNLTIGSRSGGEDGFTYYETIAGGFGGRASGDGMDGVQVGMTNTLNTPIEALEAEYPLFVERYGLRENSGGRGTYRGGLGIVRSVTVETDATVSLLTERRRVAPKGVAGGEDGTVGKNVLSDPEPGDTDETLPAKVTRDVPSGTTITVFTPGGGGYGDPADRNPDDIERDLADEKLSERS